MNERRRFRTSTRPLFAQAVVAGLTVAGLIVAGLLPWIGSPAIAGKFNRVLSVGDKAPGWTDLEGTDVQKHALADFDATNILVLVFTCNHCPVATAYQDRLVTLQKEYESQPVRLVAINSSPGKSEGLPAMKQRAESAGYNFPYLRDADQSVARAYGASKTPTAFVIGQDRKIVYMGAIDDSWADAGKLKRDYLRDALQAALDGKTPEVTESKAQGCEIEGARR